MRRIKRVSVPISDAGNLAGTARKATGTIAIDNAIAGTDTAHAPIAGTVGSSGASSAIGGCPRA